MPSEGDDDDVVDVLKFGKIEFLEGYTMLMIVVKKIWNEKKKLYLIWSESCKIGLLLVDVLGLNDVKIDCATIIGFNMIIIIGLTM